MTSDEDGWVLAGRHGAVCLSIDDVHPGRSTDAYEAGGDLSAGVLGRLERLLDRHPQLRATLFVTPQWRERSPVPTRRTLARVPFARHHVHLAPPLPRDAMRLDRHPEFAAHLREEPRFEVAVHGLFHLARGLRPPAEFASLGERKARVRLRRALGLFDRAGLEVERGLCPPGWELPGALRRALVAEGYNWVSSARDIVTPVAAGARTAMSGLRGVSLLHPQPLEEGLLVHMPVNFQATCPDARAHEILALGGLLSIKAHAVKNAFGHVALDGLDHEYCERLHHLLCAIEDQHGDLVWWTTMGELAGHVASTRHQLVAT